MFVRCLDCLGVTWIERGDCAPGLVPCGSCSRQMRLLNAHAWTTDDKAHFEDASKFAAASQIDLPSANSVLMGLMTLQNALSIQGQDPQVATRKGSSEAECAAETALREMEKKQLSRAAQMHRKIRRRMPRLESRVALLATVGMLLASAVVGWSGIKNWNREVAEGRALEALNIVTQDKEPLTVPAAKRPRITKPTRLRHDEDGDVVRIVGPSAEAVLRAYCKIDPAFEPIELAGLKEPRRGMRIGVFRDYNDLTKPYGIWIRRRETDRNWYAGGGTVPLRPFEVEYEALGPHRIAVEEDDAAELQG